MILVLLGVLCAAAVTARLLIGLSLEGLSADARDQVLTLRGHRVATGLIVGAALAASGVLLQAMMRNPLASPDLLGMASGAALAVVAWMLIHFMRTGHMHPSGVASAGVPALVGALGALAIVYTLAQRRGVVEPVSLVLVGVMVNIIAGALMLFVASWLPDQGMAALRWTVGTISDEIPSGTLWPLGVLVIAAIALACTQTRAIDAASLSDDEARSVGVPLAKLRILMLGLAGVLAAAGVVLAGPIGFIGLVAPHIVRLLIGPAARPLMIGATITGATLVVACDAISRLIELPSGRLPLGVLTALIGGPLFLVLLRRHLV